MRKTRSYDAAVGIVCVYVLEGGWGCGWGEAGGWMPLSTRPQQYCDPASLVIFCKNNFCFVSYDFHRKDNIIPFMYYKLCLPSSPSFFSLPVFLPLLHEVDVTVIEALKPI